MRKLQKTDIKPSRTKSGGMKLMTAAIEKTLPPLSVIGGDPAWLGPKTILAARYFAPVGAAEWFIVAGSRDERKESAYDDDFLCYGYASLDGEQWDWGMISIKELEALPLPFGQHVERDKYFVPRALAERFPKFAK